LGNEGWEEEREEERKRRWGYGRQSSCVNHGMQGQRHHAHEKILMFVIFTGSESGASVILRRAGVKVQHKVCTR
jgi:hypothetical protein